jgi:hypothetical protein
MKPGEVQPMLSIGNGTHILMVCCEKCEKNFNAVWSEGHRYRPICGPCEEATGEPALVGPIPREETTDA